RHNRGECIMRQILFPAALAVGLTFLPSTAQASWLSEALHRLRGDYDYPRYYDNYVAPGYYDSGYVPPAYPAAPDYYGDYGYVSPGYYSSYYAPRYVETWSYPSWYGSYVPYRYVPRYYGGYGYRGYGYPRYGHYGHRDYWH